MLPEPTPARNWSFALAMAVLLALYVPWSMGDYYRFLERQYLVIALLIHFVFDLIFALSLVELVRIIWRISSWDDKRHFHLVVRVWLVMVVITTMLFVAIRY